MNRQRSPLHRESYLRRVLRRPLGLPLFEGFWVILFLLGFVIAFALPAVQWLRELLG